MNSLRKVEDRSHSVALEEEALRRLRDVQAPPPAKAPLWQLPLKWIDAALTPGELVQRVAPGRRPKSRFEWDASQAAYGPVPPNGL